MIRELSITSCLAGVVGVATLAALLATAPVAAQTYIGTTSPGAFNNAANWDDDANPVTPSSVPAFNNTTAIVLNSPAAFGTVTPPASTSGVFTIVNDIAGVSTLNSLTFSSSGTGAITTTGGYRPITVTASPTTNSLEFAGATPSIVGNFAGGIGNTSHNLNTSVSFTANSLITATNTTATSNLNFGGTGQTFNTNDNTITIRGVNATTVAPSQLNVNINQAVAGAAKFAVTGGTGTGNGTIPLSGGSVTLGIGANTTLASGASAEITLRGGASGGTPFGGGGGSGVQYSANNNTFTPLVIFSSAGNANAFKTFALNGFSGTVTGLSSPAQSTAYFVTNATAANVTLTVNNSANYSYGGRVTNGTGTLSLVKNGTGTQTFTGTTTVNQLAYTGTTTVNNGVLTFATTLNNTLAGAMTVNNGGTLNVGSAGASVLTLSGGITVNTGGTLNILPGATVSAVDVNGGTVGGTGTLPAFTLESGATLAPGVGGAGTINAAGLTFDGGSTIAFELNQTTPSLSDRVALTGAFTKGAAGLYTFNFGATNLTGANTFDLVTFTGGTTFVPGDFTLTGLTADSGFDFNIAVTGSSVQLVSSAVAVVPESGTGLLAGLGVLLGIAVPVMRRRASAK